jgi:hypothetical protein
LPSLGFRQAQRHTPWPSPGLWGIIGNMPITGLSKATRTDHADGHYTRWSGTVNGLTASCLVNNPELELFTKPVLSPRQKGVALVDAVGELYTFQVVAR